ncbi:MAG TPA: hypothetical protein VM531_01875 [Sphingomicrobium sp.]|jgi:hypothetical protein|nr:hypothetical protein [Sphingomicrobium sp.]
MRALLLALPLALIPVPAAAAAAEAPQTQIPPELSDPAVADKLTRALGPLSRALMNMPVGELEAALSGREPTAADRSKRLADQIGPDGQKDVEATIAAAGPQMRAMQKALVASLPAIMSALGGMEKELERAAANMPDPTYPKR